MIEPGPTGRFPKGKIHPTDEGELALRIGHSQQGKVVVDFGKAVVWIGLDPDDADIFAERLKECAKNAREHKK